MTKRRAKTSTSTADAAPRPSLQSLLYQANREALADLDRSVGVRGMPVASWRVLEVLADEQGRTMTALAAETGMLMPATSKLVDRMIEAALIQRSIDPQDNRRVVVYISDLGLARVAALKDGLEERRQEVVRALTPAREALLRELLADFIRIQQSSR